MKTKFEAAEQAYIEVIQALITDNMISLEENQMETLEDNEFDIYTLGFWSEKKVSTIEAIEQVSKNWMKNFEDSKLNKVVKKLSSVVQNTQKKMKLK